MIVPSLIDLRTARSHDRLWGAIGFCLCGHDGLMFDEVFLTSILEREEKLPVARSIGLANESTVSLERSCPGVHLDDRALVIILHDLSHILSLEG